MAEALQLGRYSVFAELASGGMATVYLGRMSGAVGFGRTVAIKRLHPHLARDPEFVSMFLDEARLAARVQHPNVVPTLDVVTTDNELFLVLEYIKGESVGGLVRASRAAGRSIPIPVVVSIAVGLLNGLHAAHEAKDERGVPLSIVHRDVSPQNVIVGADGVARVLDFGVAKASTRLQTTRDGQIKGKIAYMAPEQIGGNATRQSDIYSAGVVIWEALALARLFTGENDAALLKAVIMPNIQPPSAFNPDVSQELDRIVMRALATNPEERFVTARDMAEALDTCVRPASANQVTAWLESLAGPSLLARSALVAEAESHSGTTGRSEVKKLVELGAAALLSSESGPSATMGHILSMSARPSAPPATGTSLSVSGLTLKDPAPKKSRGWMLAVTCALLAGTMGGVIIVAARTPRPPPIQAVNSPPAGPTNAATTTRAADPPGVATNPPPSLPARDPDSTSVSKSREPGAESPSAAAAIDAGSAAGSKRKPSTVPPAKPKPASTSDIDSLLDSH